MQFVKIVFFLLLNRSFNLQYYIKCLAAASAAPSLTSMSWLGTWCWCLCFWYVMLSLLVYNFNDGICECFFLCANTRNPTERITLTSSGHLVSLTSEWIWFIKSTEKTKWSNSHLHLFANTIATIFNICQKYQVLDLSATIGVSSNPRGFNNCELKLLDEVKRLQESGNSPVAYDIALSFSMTWMSENPHQQLS